MKRMNISRYVVMAMAVLVMSMTSGCVTTDTASSRLPELQKNINAAKAADAEVYAPEPLQSAEAKLAVAKLAVQAKDMVSANRLIDEAMVDAEYAKTMAPTEKAKSEAMKLRESIQAVRDEIMQLPTVK